MTATAERWWVRLAARWLARVEAVSDIVRMAMLTLTGLSTATVALSEYGYAHFAGPLIVATVGSGVAFTYFYTEGGVYNQKNRDRADLGSNYAQPGNYIDDMIIGAAMFAALHGRPPDDEEVADIEKAVGMVWSDLRDGVDLDDLDRGGSPGSTETDEQDDHVVRAGD